MELFEQMVVSAAFFILKIFSSSEDITVSVQILLAELKVQNANQTPEFAPYPNTPRRRWKSRCDTFCFRVVCGTLHRVVGDGHVVQVRLITCGVKSFGPESQTHSTQYLRRGPQWCCTAEAHLRSVCIVVLNVRRIFMEVHVDAAKIATSRRIQKM